MGPQDRLYAGGPSQPTAMSFNATPQILDIYRPARARRQTGDADWNRQASLALHLAIRSSRSQTARLPRRRADAALQADYDRGSLLLQMGDRRACRKAARRFDFPAP